LFLGLTQLAPIYLGFELLTGQRDPDRWEERIEEEVAEEMQKNEVMVAPAVQPRPVRVETPTVLEHDSPTVIETGPSPEK
jgi:hypothetical protein